MNNRSILRFLCDAITLYPISITLKTVTIIRINTGSTPSKKKGMDCYIMGDTISSYVSKYWMVKEGLKVQ